MNTFSLVLHFISIFGSLFISHSSLISGEYNISISGDSSSTAAAAQDVITAYALADSYERNNSEKNLILGTEGDEGEESPTLSSVKLASKWMHSIIDASEPTHDDDAPRDDLDEEETGIEETINTVGEYNSSSTETIKEVREPAVDDTVYGTSDSILADNVTVLELLKEQIARDFAPFIIIINAITPAPVKAFLAAQFAILSARLQLVFRGAFSPLLSTAAKAFRFTGNGLIFISQELVKWQEASEAAEKPATVSQIPDNGGIASPPLDSEEEEEDSSPVVLVDSDSSEASKVKAEADIVSDTLPSELEIIEEIDEEEEDYIEA